MPCGVETSVGCDGLWTRTQPSRLFARNWVAPPSIWRVTWYVLAAGTHRRLPRAPRSLLWCRALGFARPQGHSRIAKLLVEAGADIHVLDSFGLSAAHYAVAAGHTSTWTMLLAAGFKFKYCHRLGEASRRHRSARSDGSHGDAAGVGATEAVVGDEEVGGAAETKGVEAGFASALLASSRDMRLPIVESDDGEEGASDDAAACDQQAHPSSDGTQRADTTSGRAEADEASAAEAANEADTGAGAPAPAIGPHTGEDVAVHGDVATTGAPVPADVKAEDHEQPSHPHKSRKSHKAHKGKHKHKHKHKHGPERLLARRRKFVQRALQEVQAAFQDSSTGLEFDTTSHQRSMRGKSRTQLLATGGSRHTMDGPGTPRKASAQDLDEDLNATKRGELMIHVIPHDPDWQEVEEVDIPSPRVSRPCPLRLSKRASVDSPRVFVCLCIVHVTDHADLPYLPHCQAQALKALQVL